MNTASTLPLSRRLPRRGFTLIELLVVITIIGILASFAFGAFAAVKRLAQKTQAKNDANQLALAITAYHNEYGRYPTAGEGGADETLQSTAGLLDVLTGVDTTRNPRGISFFEGREAKNDLAGVTRDGILVDPWGSPYSLMIDGDYDKEMVNPDKSEGASDLIRKGVIVWSEGPDQGQPDSGGNPWDDNVATWK